MNSKQRIERIEARRRRVETVPDDSRARILAKLQQLADRRPTDEPAPVVTLAEVQERIAQLKATMQTARADYERQRQQPKAESWLKLQRKQNRH